LRQPGLSLPDSCNVQVREPSTPEDFRRYFELRWRILRAPWDQPRGSECDPLDEHSTHLMLTGADDQLIGVGRLHFNNIREAQIRYMAIDIPCQRRGLGKLLLASLESRARELGAARIVLDARESALGFYRKNGYVALGTGHVLFNRIAHMHMAKQLDNWTQGR
jgi:predicted GNAT family N-acyltransferase